MSSSPPVTPPPLSRFAKCLDNVAPKFALLLGTHICDLHRARSALESKRLRASPCEKFNQEELLYLFYGKPSFRPNSSAKEMRLPAFFPVCFVIKLSSSIMLKRVFPFDTGAHPKRYARFFHEAMSLDDFLLPGSCESARRVVEGFFSSNADYYDCKPMASFRALRTIESTSYYEMIRSFGGGQPADGDDRLAAIELQATADVALDSGTVARVLVPDKALELEDVRSALVACGVLFESYATGSLGVPECQGLINEMVRKLNTF